MMFNRSQRYQTYFNPRSHEGSDSPESVPVAEVPKNFNPRSHEGSDPTLSRKLPNMILFQSTLPRGERQLMIFA